MFMLPSNNCHYNDTYVNSIVPNRPQFNVRHKCSIFQENAKGTNNAHVTLLLCTIVRLRLGSVCAAIVSSIPELCAGVELQDLIAVLGTIDLVLGELDR
jgi:NADH:ubiquinone oxidoreductase subunit D